MKFTRQQRINNSAAAMVQDLNNTATEYRKWLTDGLDIPAGSGYPAMKSTAEELIKALDENAKPIQIVVDFVLDGKSNKITKLGAKK